MTLDRRLLNWGLFFIVLGAVPLAVRQGLVTRESVADWWSLWPLLIVAAGVGLLLRRTQLEFVGGLLVAGTFGLMAGSVLAGGATVPFSSCGSERGTVPFGSRGGEFGSTANVELDLNCGDITVRTAEGSGWRLEGADEDGRGPSVVSNDSRLQVRSEDRSEPFGFFGKRDLWTVTLPTDPNLDLGGTLNAGRTTMNLDGLHIDRVRFGVNAGEARLDLADVAEIGSVTVELNAGSARLNLPSLSFTGRFTVNAGSIDFCVPDGVGVRIRTNDNITAGNNFGSQGLTRSGNTWESPNYASAQVRIDLEAEANAGSFTMNPTGGCDA